MHVSPEPCMSKLKDILDCYCYVLLDKEHLGSKQPRINFQRFQLRVSEYK